MATAAKPKATATAGTIVREFALEQELKGAHRFRQDEEPNGERAAIGTLYLTKAVLNAELDGGSARIRVTVEAID